MNLISPLASIAATAQIWDLAQVREHAHIGERTTIGRGAYVGSGVLIGADCKIQNHALLYEPCTVGRGVFVGPGVIFTNDKVPRAVTNEMTKKGPTDWKQAAVKVDDGASIGAGAICVAPVSIGSWAMVAAGAVVTKDVPSFALVAGIPARQIAWVGHSGYRLECVDDELGIWKCPQSNETFIQNAGGTLAPTTDL